MLPSRTAAGVARARAQLTRPATADGDPDGEERLNADLAYPAHTEGPMFHHIAARTRFFDAVTQAAVDGGTAQIVIIGAGYDGRALRFRRTGVRYFELDQLATQDDKRERLARLGIASDDIAFVPIDLTTDEIDAELAAAGHDAAQPSLFICEGLLVYLDVAVIERMFRGLRSRADEHATLAMSVSRRDRVVADPIASVRRAFMNRRMRLLGEPWRTSLAAEEWQSLLEATGWNVVGAVDPHEIDAEAPTGGALLMTALSA